MKESTKFGIDILLETAENYKNLRIALACNLASNTSSGTHSRIALLKNGFNITKLFAPEHGFDIQGEDGAYINHQIDSATGIPIVSLYGEKLAPHKEDLDDIDIVFIDLPDIGSRFYTYLWTLSHVLESCEKFQKKVVILDRPNPLAQPIHLAEGPILQPSCSSFIGRFPIPVTHQCTFGELALYFQTHYFPQVQLEVIKMENWNRAKNTNFPFFPTSPAIQNRETIYTYAGACLFEGLNINEGRGSDYPFAQFGAPWIDSKILFKNLAPINDQVELEIVTYTPTISLYAGEECYGLRVVPQDPMTFQSFQYFIKMIQKIYELFPENLQERNYLTNANPTGTKHLDKLIGIPNSFDLLISGRINTQLAPEEWLDKITPFLLYE